MQNLIPNTLKKSLLIIIGGAVGGFGAILTTSSVMSLNASTQPYQIPYQGRLEQGGVPENGTFNFVFRLYDAPTDPDPVTADDESLVWESTTRNLFVSDGNFSVILGDATDIDNDDAGNQYDGEIEEMVMAHDELYVGIEVAGTQLSGRQKLIASPTAQRGEPNRDFVIDGKAMIADLDVSGTSSLETVNVGGNLDVDGQTTLDYLWIQGPTWGDSITAYNRFRVENNRNSAISTQRANINFGEVTEDRRLRIFETDPGLLDTFGDFAYLEYERLTQSPSTLRLAIENESDDRIALNQAGADRLVVDNGNVEVNGDLEVSGEIKGKLGGTCTWSARGPNVGGDERYHTLECEDDEYMSGWECYANSYLDGNCRVKCCSM